MYIYEILEEDIVEEHKSQSKLLKSEEWTSQFYVLGQSLADGITKQLSS